MSPTAASQTWSTSSDLLSQVRRRDQDAWRRFVLLYAPLIYGWCRRVGIAADDAGDVSQDVFARVFAAIDQFRHDRPSDTLRGWLRVIWRNRINDFFNRRNESPAAVGGSDARAIMNQIVADDDDSTITLDEKHELVRRAAELIQLEFETRSWQAFMMIAVERRTAAETATQLGMTIGAVRQAKYMILKRLRDQLAGEES